jgi:outer membrane protein TolC
LSIKPFFLTVGSARGPSRTILFLAGLLSAAILPGTSRSAFGEELEFDLSRALEMAVASSHLVRAADFEEEQAEVRIRRARAERYVPETELHLETGVVPAARGTAVDSQENMDSVERLGPFFKANIKVVQPLYTFGRLRYLEQTARDGLEAARSKGELTLQGLSLLVVQTYWSLSSSRRAYTLSQELRESFQGLLDEVARRLEDEDSEIDDTDLLRVKSSTYRIEKIYLDARENVRRSELALRILVGAGEEPEISLKDVPSPELTASLEDFRNYVVEKGVAFKEIEVLEAASRALASKIELTRSDRYPLLFLAAGAGYAQAPGRDDQTNPFVLDDFNYARIGAEVGLKWKPNIYRSNLEVEELEKEQGSLLEKLEALKQKLTVEASESFGEALKNRDLLEAARVSLRASKSWLRLSVDNWEMGILLDVKRLLDAYEAYYEMRGIEIEREMEYNVSLSRVASSLGDVNLYLSWVRNGKTYF